jgi:prophage tail gpP-like protein
VPSEVVLKIADTAYGGWKSMRISQGIEQVSGGFELSVTEKWPDQISARDIAEGSPCKVLLGGDTVIFGHVDSVRTAYNARSHSVTVCGRDKTGDLVDCSAVAGSGQWKGRTLLQIAEDICRPYRIEVISDTDVGAAFDSVNIQEGESAYEILERLARMRGVLLTATAEGRLLITRASRQTIKTSLVRGTNILSGNGTRGIQDRYSIYVVKAENRGSDWSTPEQNARTFARVEDPVVKRHRCLVVLSEECGDAAKLKDRGVWESIVRMARGVRATITVQGWRHAAGLWKSNRRVFVDDDFLGIKGEMLISGVTYWLDEQGSRTELELCRPEAFDLRPIPDPEDGNPWG